MNSLQKYSNKYSFPLFKYYSRNIHKSHAWLADEITAKESPSEEKFDILEELREPKLTEEEILQKRFKSRLPEFVYKKFVKKEAHELTNKYEFRVTGLQLYYGRFGKASKLNPGIFWPTREELLETIKYDKVFEPPLEVRLKNVEEARLAEKAKKQEVEAEVEKNMANLDKWIAEYHAKIEKKKAEQLALKQKKERLIDEISEYLGYDIDPRDPRFQEAVEQREKDKKKALKVKKQQESYDKMLAKLKQMADKK